VQTSTSQKQVFTQTLYHPKVLKQCRNGAEIVDDSWNSAPVEDVHISHCVLGIGKVSWNIAHMDSQVVYN